MISEQQIPKKGNTHAMPPTTTKTKITSNQWSLISFNINGLNLSIKRHRLTDLIQKENSFLCSVQESSKTNITSK